MLSELSATTLHFIGGIIITCVGSRIMPFSRNPDLYLDKWKKICILRKVLLKVRLGYFFLPRFSGTNYEMSPFLYISTLGLLYHNVLLQKVHYIVLWTLPISLFIQLIFHLSTDRKFSITGESGYSILLYIYGTINSSILFAIKIPVLNAEISTLNIQWPLKQFQFATSTVTTFAERGIIQSFISAVIFLLSAIYAFLVIAGLERLSTVAFVSQLSTPILTCFIQILESVNVLSITYFAIVIPQLYLYFATGATMQTALLADFVDKLAGNRVLTGCYSDQTEMRECLRRILFRHEELSQYYKENDKVLSTNGIVYITSGTVFAVFSLYAFAQGILEPTNHSVYFMVIAIMSVNTMVCGQYYEDAWLLYYEAICRLPWYNWSIKNQKAYLLLVVGSSKITKLVVFHTTAINYNLMLQAWKFTYTCINAVFNLNLR